MSLRLLTAGLVAALPLAAIPAASAADLGPPSDYGYSESPYDDPRYADIYRDPKPPYAPPFRKPCAERDYGCYDEGYDPPAHGKWRGEYLEPLPPPPEFDEYRPRKAYLPPACLPRHEIRRALIEDGWSDLHDFEFGKRKAFLTARRPNGSLYRLEVDRCDGEVVRAERIEHAHAHSWSSRRKGYPTF
jgi:hypothetical protein